MTIKEVQCHTQSMHLIAYFPQTILLTVISMNQRAVNVLRGYQHSTVSTLPERPSPVLLRDETWRVVLEVLRLPNQLLQQLDVALRVQLKVQRHCVCEREGQGEGGGGEGRTYM